MPERATTVTWSTSGRPPAYVEQRWRAEVPVLLAPAFNALLERTRFFELPADLGPNHPDGRDMGTYRILVTAGSRTHEIRFSDSAMTQDLANLKNWIQENLGPAATRQ